MKCTSLPLYMVNPYYYCCSYYCSYVCLTKLLTFEGIPILKKLKNSCGWIYVFIQLPLFECYYYSSDSQTQHGVKGQCLPKGAYQNLEKGERRFFSNSN